MADVFADCTIDSYRKIMLINSFTNLDSTLLDLLYKSEEVFLSCPEGIPELPYNYFSVMVNSEDLSKENLKLKMDLNPIKIHGRLCLIKGTTCILILIYFFIFFFLYMYIKPLVILSLRRKIDNRFLFFFF